MKSNQTSVAIITGASRGLGRSMALHLAERGVDSIVTYHTRDDEARAVVRAIADGERPPQRDLLFDPKARWAHG